VTPFLGKADPFWLGDAARLSDQDAAQDKFYQSRMASCAEHGPTAAPWANWANHQNRLGRPNHCNPNRALRFAFCSSHLPPLRPYPTRGFLTRSGPAPQQFSRPEAVVAALWSFAAYFTGYFVGDETIIPNGAVWKGSTSGANPPRRAASSFATPRRLAYCVQYLLSLFPASPKKVPSAFDLYVPGSSPRCQN